VPFPFLVPVLVATKSTTVATYAAYAATSCYYYGSDVLDWFSPWRVLEREYNERIELKVKEMMENRAQQVVVDINAAQALLEQRVIETAVSLDNINQTQSVLIDSTDTLVSVVDDTAEGAQSMMQSTLVTEEELRVLRQSMRQKDEELRLINERLQLTQHALAEKEVLLEHHAKALEDTHVQLRGKVVSLNEAEEIIATLSVQKNNEADSGWHIVTSHTDTASKIHQHDDEIARLNRIVLETSRRADLLAQEKEVLKNDNRNLNNDYQALTNKNNTLIDSKEMLMEKLLQAHETIESLEGKLEEAANSRPSQSSPRFFSK